MLYSKQNCTTISSHWCNNVLVSFGLVVRWAYMTNMIKKNSYFEGTANTVAFLLEWAGTRMRVKNTNLLSAAVVKCHYLSSKSERNDNQCCQSAQGIHGESSLLVRIGTSQPSSLFDCMNMLMSTLVKKNGSSSFFTTGTIGQNFTYTLLKLLLN